MATALFVLGLYACKPAPSPVPAPTSPQASQPTQPSRPPADTLDITAPVPPSTAGATPQTGNPATASEKWSVESDPVWTLLSKDGGLMLSCEEGKKTLRLSYAPYWELEGPYDNATVYFGDKAFPLKVDLAAQKTDLDKLRPIYLLPANADTVTAVMMATNMRLVMTNQNGVQERKGEPDDTGAFDMFATTCAQTNGLR